MGRLGISRRNSWPSVDGLALGLAQLTGFGSEFFQHTLEGVRRWT